MTILNQRRGTSGEAEEPIADLKPYPLFFPKGKSLGKVESADPPATIAVDPKQPYDRGNRPGEESQTTNKPQSHQGTKISGTI